MSAAPSGRRRARGLTLVEVSVAAAVAGMLLATAWPALDAYLKRARRLDATSALTRLQMAQERHLARHGRYASELAALRPGSGARSEQGLYELALTDAGDGRVVLVARVRADGAQRDDRECAEITLRLGDGVAERGPSGRCWGQG